MNSCEECIQTSNPQSSEDFRTIGILATFFEENAIAELRLFKKHLPTF